MHFCHKICKRNHLEFGDFLCATSDVGTSTTVEDMINSHTIVGGSVGTSQSHSSHQKTVFGPVFEAILQY